MNELKRHADAGKVLVRIRATCLVRVEHGESGRRAFLFIREVVIRNDHVETVVASPVKGFVRANATVDADDEFVSFGDGAFECWLLNAVAFGETMRNVKTGAGAEKFQRSEERRVGKEDKTR